MLKVTTLLLLLSAGAQAQQFDPLAQTIQANFPDTHHFGVVCHYESSRSEVAELARALGDNARLSVVDIASSASATPATSALTLAGAQMMVLLPKDRFMRDGSYYATVAIHALPPSLPAVGTKREALDNGAAFAIGEGTGFELLVNKNLRGVIGPITATKAAQVGGSAQITFLRAR